jgi:hypothetical protein
MGVAAAAQFRAWQTTKNREESSLAAALATVATVYDPQVFGE